MSGDTTATRKPSALLVSLPWTTLSEPSLGLSILRAVLDQRGIPCRVWHLNVFLLQYLRATTYYSLANVFALNDFMFSGVLEPAISTRQQRWLREKTLQMLQLGLIDAQAHGGVDGVIDELTRLRSDVIPSWLESCASEIAASSATLVGFTCMFDQTIASVALAYLVKQRAPDKTIALGGYAVGMPTAETVMRAFPWIDAVCIGEGEHVIEPLVRSSAGELPLSNVPGILYRTASGIPLASAPAPQVVMDESPVPNFDDYFADLRELSQVHKVDIQPEALPFENSRGCWWGQKHHCVFCGIHDNDLRYRVRHWENVIDALEALSARYGMRAFRFSDYILPYSYYKTLLPALASSGRPYKLIAEMKANVSAENFALLAAAGFEEVQPGIESFSTPVLKQMDKGVTAVQNVFTLLLGKLHGVTVHYNLLYGLPSDREADYEAMLHGLTRLRHLNPPSTRVEIQVTRFAPLQTNPARFGIPEASHEHSYDLIFSQEYLRNSGFDLDSFCYYFTRPFENSPRLTRLYEKINAVVDEWREEYPRRQIALEYYESEDGFVVFDSRREPATTFHLSREESAVLRGCAAPISLSRLCERLSSTIPADRVRAAIEELDARQLVFIENDDIVALALPARDQAGSTLQLQ